jgi:transposase InsO family protein
MKVVHPKQGCEAGVGKPTNLEPELRMNIHENARMTVHGRLLLVARVREQGWRVGDAALAAGVSKRSACKWLARWRARSPRSQLGARPLAPPAAGRGGGRDRAPAPAAAERAAAPQRLADPPRRDRRCRPPRLQRAPLRATTNVGPGSQARLADERKASAIAFLDRARAWFGRQGVTVERVMTDNGAAYRSHAFRHACAAAGLRHLRTRPHTPRTNGKAERFIQTALRAWAYARPYASSLERSQAITLAAPLQPPPTPRRHPRRYTHRATEQPPWKRQLVQHAMAFRRLF